MSLRTHQFEYPTLQRRVEVHAAAKICKGSVHTTNCRPRHPGFSKCVSLVGWFAAREVLFQSRIVRMSSTKRVFLQHPQSDRCTPEVWEVLREARHDAAQAGTWEWCRQLATGGAMLRRFHSMNIVYTLNTRVQGCPSKVQMTGHDTGPKQQLPFMFRQSPG